MPIFVSIYDCLRAWCNPKSISNVRAAAFVVFMPVSVKTTLLFCKPLPCNPAVETAIQPLIWCSEGSFSQGSSSPEEGFFHRHRKDHQTASTTNVTTFRLVNLDISSEFYQQVLKSMCGDGCSGYSLLVL